MRIARLDLARYGAFTSRTVDFGPAPKDGEPDLHVVFGPNEAGKSTLFSAWLDLLFGFEGNAYAFEHARDTLEVGGRFDLAGGAREIVRRGRSPIARDDDDAVRGVLGALQRSDYATMFSLDTEELENGGRAILSSEGRLGELLFSAGTGLSRLGEELERVRGEAEGFYKFNGSKHELKRLRDEMVELEERMRSADLQADEHAALVKARDEAERAHAAIEAEHAEAARQLAEVDRMLRALRHEDERREAQAGVDRLEPLPEAPRDWDERLTAIALRAAGRVERERTLANERERIEEERAEVRLDPGAIAAAPLLDALDGMRDEHGVPLEHRMSAGSGDLDRRRADLAEAVRRVDHCLAQVGGADAGDGTAFRIDPARMERLRELAEARSGIAGDRDAAREEVERAEAEMRRLEALSPEGMDVQADPEALLAARSSLRALVTRGLLPELEGAERDLRLASRTLDARLAALGVDLDALRALRPVPSHALAALEERHRDLVARRAELDRAEEAARAEAARLRARRDAIDVPGDEKARVLRDARERAWRAHVDALDGPDAGTTATDFAEALARDDAISERRLLAATDLAARRDAERALAEVEAGATTLREARTRLEGEDDALAARIAEFYAAPAALGLIASAPDVAAARAWSESHDALIALHGEVANAEARVAVAREELDDHLADLASKIAVPLPLHAPAVAMERAETWLDEMRDERRSLEDLARRLGEARAALMDREERLERASRADERWRDDWARGLEGTFLADDPRLSCADDEEPRIRATLRLAEAADALCGAVDERERRAHQVASIERDREAFLAALGAICASLDMPAPEAEGWAARLDAIRTRVLAAHEAAERGRALDARERRRADDERDLVTERESDELALEPMRSALGAAAIAELTEALSKVRDRDRLRDRAGEALGRIATELRLDASEALARIEEADRDALGIERDALATRMESLDAKRNEARDELTEARKALRDVGGDDAAARLAAAQQLVIERIKDGAMRALALEFGAKAAEDALHRYRETHRSGMMERASEAFAAISRGAFAGLRSMPSEGEEVLAALRPDDRMITVPRRARKGQGRAAEGGLSKGTRHQLYLALRIAGYHEYAARRAPPPFLCDDVMETFDDERASATLRLLGEMSTHGQVIVLTHHRHLCDLARDAVPGVRCHALGGPVEGEAALRIAAE